VRFISSIHFVSFRFGHFVFSVTSIDSLTSYFRRCSQQVCVHELTRQSQTSDFAPNAALGESLWVYAPSASPLPGWLWANMTSSTKPEVHNILHCRQKRTEPRPHLTWTENFVNFERVVFEIHERTDTQTYRATSQYFALLPGRSN